MKSTLIAFAQSFVDGRISADVFAEAYLELWKIERNAKALGEYDSTVRECLSSIFCAADIYNSDENKEEYELDGDQLKAAIENLLAKLNDQ